MTIAQFNHANILFGCLSIILNKRMAYIVMHPNNNRYYRLEKTTKTMPGTGRLYCWCQDVNLKKCTL